GARASMARRSAKVAGRMGVGLFLVYVVWAVTLFDLHYFLGNVVAAPLGRLLLLVYIPLLAMVALQGPAILVSMKSWVWYPPLLLMLFAGLGSIPVVINTMMAKTGLQTLLLYYVLAVG